MNELGLNQQHQSLMISYMKFSKYMRLQYLKQIAHSFQDVESRLYDDTFTKEEVKEIIKDLEKIIIGDAESEFISFSHNNVLMLKQLFQQAEKWYLRLQIDLSELQNQEELAIIKQLESDETQILCSSPNANKNSDVEEGSIALLKLEIERLKEENERLSNIIQDSEDMADLYKKEKNKLGEKLLAAQKEMGKYKNLLENSSRANNNDEKATREMEKKLDELENLLTLKTENLKTNENQKDKLKNELMSTKEKVKQVEAQLQLAEEELEKKFSETKAYANMKSILIKKNEKIKQLRKQLLQCKSDGKKEDEENEEKEEESD